MSCEAKIAALTVSFKVLVVIFRCSMLKDWFRRLSTCLSYCLTTCEGKIPNFNTNYTLGRTVRTVQFFQTSVAIVIVCFAEMGRIPCCGRPESFSSDI